MAELTQAYLEGTHSLPFEPLELEIFPLPGGELSKINGIVE